MKLIYKVKWAIVILFAITFAASFVVLFVGGAAVINKWLLAANVSLIIALSANVIYLCQSVSGLIFSKKRG